jgi:hypothetical protein
MMSNNLDDVINEMMCDFARTVAWFCCRGYELTGSEYGSLKWKRPDGETVLLSRYEMSQHAQEVGEKERFEAEERSEKAFKSAILAIAQESPSPVSGDRIKQEVIGRQLEVLFNGYPKKADERDFHWAINRLTRDGKLLLTSQGEYAVAPEAE